MISYDQYLQFSPYFAQEDMDQKGDRLNFLKLFSALPQTVKNVLTSLDTAEKIINTGKTFGLDEFDTEALSFAVRKIATGEVFIGNGVELIASEVGLTPERAKNLLSLVVNEIFAPALEDIKKIQTAKFPQRFGAGQVSSPQRKDNIGTGAANPNIINLRNRQN